ncbi:MAG: hypothetical protein LQ344_002275 [Seirophora lacunosa]|nr:MAG: hypothetical protein LQ344_002275 [Seirophora lacunosa]
MPRQLPLTPPEYYETYLDRAVGAIYRAGQCANQPCSSSRYEYYDLDQYSLSKQSGYRLPPSTRTASGKENDRWLANGVSAPPNGFTGLPHSSSVPLLPPIQVPERLSMEPRQVHSRKTPPAPPTPPIKEEKAIGGVSAYLDYEMDSMAEFVAEMAQGMYDLYESRICLADIDILQSVHPKSPGVPGVSAFRKYVLQVLSSTRLPSSTIFLGLHYLLTRMSMLSSNGVYPKSRGEIYRLLTTALLLGSKFLDDNTFQNRSWSEVSSIPVGELNVLELEWLDAINWKLHVDPGDTRGFTLWRIHWQRWQGRRFEKSLETLKLTPMDLNHCMLQQAKNPQQSAESIRSPANNNSSAYSNPGLTSYKTSPWYATPYDRWPSIQSRTEYSPPSAPQTGPTTPEWYSGPAECGYTQTSHTLSARSMQPTSHYAFPAVQPTAYSAPYNQPYGGKKWNGHLLSCSCTYCMPSTDRHLVNSGYRLQSVFG